jgi:hypothetical protein
LIFSIELNNPVWPYPEAKSKKFIALTVYNSRANLLVEIEGVMEFEW